MHLVLSHRGFVIVLDLDPNVTGGSGLLKDSKIISLGLLQGQQAFISATPVEDKKQTQAEKRVTCTLIDDDSNSNNLSRPTVM